MTEAPTADEGAAGDGGDDLEAVTDAVLLASRALVAVASRSVAAVDGAVTLPQFRALVVLDRYGGRRNVGELAQQLRIQPSTATRLCDGLVRRGLVRRRVEPTNRREVTITLTDAGRALVREVTERRPWPGWRSSPRPPVSPASSSWRSSPRPRRS